MITTDSVLELIGKTPLVKLMPPEGAAGNVFVKAEHLNPSGSLKDRIALTMIREAEKQGALKPGMVILESSTGNTAVSFSMVGTRMGYEVHIYETYPGKIAGQKKKIIEAYGAKVCGMSDEEVAELTARNKNIGGTIYPGRLKCLELEKHDANYWWARQFANPANALAHEELAEEIIDQMRGEKIDAFCASLGTGGTMLGIARVLRRHNPKMHIIGVRPAGATSNMTIGSPPPATQTSGGLITDLMGDTSLLNDIVRVSDADAIEEAHALQREGFFAGGSSGANVLIAKKLAREGCKNVVTVLPDSADRYFEKEVYST